MMEISSLQTTLKLYPLDKAALKQALWIAADVLNGLYVPAQGEAPLQLNDYQKKELKQRISKLFNQL